MHGIEVCPVDVVLLKRDATHNCQIKTLTAELIDDEFLAAESVRVVLRFKG